MEVTVTKATFPKYPAYKESGVEWLGQIPEGWEYTRMKRLYTDYSKKNRPDAELLSVTQNQGVVPRTWVENRMVMPSGALESFKFINKGDFAISLRSFEGGLEYCHHDGIISPAYTVLKKRRNDLIEGFYKYLFKSYSFISELQTSVVGIREGKNISYPELSYSFLPVPRKEEQTAIAKFLDDKTAKIDQAITQKEQLIALLKERKQIIIQNAVTKGLDPNVKLKDSGVEWIGEIPEYWEVEKGKWLYIQEKRPVRKEDEIITCFRDGQVTLRKNRKTEGFTNALKEHGYQGIRVGDLVIHNMDAFAGAIGVSDSDGKSTPVYSVCTARKDNTVNSMYYAYYLRELARKGYIQALAKGIRERSTDFRFNDFANLEYALPPLSEQNEIVAYVDDRSVKLDEAILFQHKQIEKLKEYKATLIDSAVTGKIKVC